MASKKEKAILKKLKILLTQQFNDPEAAFAFFDKNNNAALNRDEVKTLLKSAKVSSFISSIASSKLIEKFDHSQDKVINWKEFKKAVKGIETV